jgi:hypothetical protein
MKIIGGWFNTDGSLISLYGMFDLNSDEILLGKDERLWNGVINFKFIKVKIAKQKTMKDYWNNKKK